MILGKNLPLSRDGILYSVDDQVKIACNDCRGCTRCCENMDDTIILDPYDIWQLTHKLKISGGGRVNFDILVSEDGPLELGMHDGVILPHMKMVATDDENKGVCSFLAPNGRCSIHFCRPGMCRLYPLGRLFEENEDGEVSLGYFILNEELGCPIANTSYTSVDSWLGYADKDKYQDYQIKWRNVRRVLREAGEDVNADINALEKILIECLEHFFAHEYGEDFFAEFDRLYEEWVNI